MYVLFICYYYSQVAELSFLLQQCCHGNKTVADAARHCILSLIDRDLVDLEGCVNQLLLLISSSQ